MKRVFPLLLVFLLAARADARREDERAIVYHQVQEGDSLPLLAAEYYGDRQFAVFIMVMNGMDHPRKLKPNESLKIPTAWKYQAVAGETLVSLAERFLGDARRAAYLGEFNGLPEDTTLATGQEVMIPFHVRHTAQSKETLESVAAAFYGDTSKAKLLEGYNFRRSRPLKKGESIIIPIAHVRIRESRLPAQDPQAARRLQKRKEMGELALKVLPAARRAWRRGDYGAVKRDLTELDVDYLDASVAAQAAFLLGSAYVAFGDEDSALAQFKRVRERQPDFVVKASTTSPKITRVWKRAGGQVKDE